MWSLSNLTFLPHVYLRPSLGPCIWPAWWSGENNLLIQILDHYAHAICLASSCLSLLFIQHLLWQPTISKEKEIWTKCKYSEGLLYNKILTETYIIWSDRKQWNWKLTKLVTFDLPLIAGVFLKVRETLKTLVIWSSQRSRIKLLKRNFPSIQESSSTKWHYYLERGLQK